MRKPVVGKPRSVPSSLSSLSRTLPRLSLPRSVPPSTRTMPHPTVGKAGRVVSAMPSLPVAPPQADACNRCGHGEAAHPLRYVCDRYPHPDPLQICGCELERPEEVCGACGHKGRAHKVTHRCHAPDGCGCWGYERVSGGEVLAGSVC